MDKMANLFDPPERQRRMNMEKVDSLKGKKRQDPFGGVGFVSGGLLVFGWFSLVVGVIMLIGGLMTGSGPMDIYIGGALIVSAFANLALGLITRAVVEMARNSKKMLDLGKQ